MYDLLYFKLINLDLYSSSVILSQFNEEHLIFKGHLVQMKLIKPEKYFIKKNITSG